VRNQKVAIFDFDGTLADVADLLQELYNDEAKRRGWPKITRIEYKRLRRGTLKQAIAWVGVKPWQLPGLLRAGRKSFRAKSQSVKLFPGTIKLINQLESEGWKIYILSSNSSKTIKQILKRNKVDNRVHVLKRPTIFGKASSIKNLLRTRRYKKNNVFLIGDEVRDIEAAKKSGINSIAVTWGLQDASVLKSYKPQLLASTPKQIKSYLTRATKNLER
jgi:HAD superfamily hydrolase (TIGR01549 family)